MLIDNKIPILSPLVIEPAREPASQPVSQSVGPVALMIRRETINHSKIQGEIYLSNNNLGTSKYTYLTK